MENPTIVKPRIQKTVIALALLVAALNPQFSTARAQTVWTPRPVSGYWSSIVCSADGTKVYAAAQGQIFASTDSGVTWAIRNTSQNWHYVTCSADGTKLVASCGDYTPVFTSADSGTNFTEHTDSSYSVNSLASSADGTKLVVAASGYDIFTSTNSGGTWVDQAQSLGLFSTLGWSSVACSTNGTQIVATAKYRGLTPGDWIYTSADSGVSWVQRAITNNWQAVASSADGTKLVAAVLGGQIYTSSDSGTNWTPRAFATNWQAVASSADGTKLVAAVNNGQLYTSTDSGTNWIAGDTSRAWQAVACSADGTKLFAADYGSVIYIAGVVIVPTLSIRNLGSSVVVYWQYPSTGWTLHQNTSLTSAGWSSSSGVTNNGYSNYIMAAPPAGTMFFRLQSPP
jgi:hypothetical protein